MADPDMWFRLTDLQGAYLYVSPQVEGFLGWTPEEFTQKSGFDMMHPDDLEWAKASMAHLADGPISAIYRMRHKDDSWVWVNTHIQILDDAILAIGRSVPQRLQGRHWQHEEGFA